jgi:hypothetical protein
MAEAVADHPSAFGAELMNEPMSIKRKDMFNTWRACAEAITSVVPDMSITLADTGEGAVLPGWITDLTGGHEDISSDTIKWIRDSNNVFYAWHWYGSPSPEATIKNVQVLCE